MGCKWIFRIKRLPDGSVIGTKLDWLPRVFKYVKEGGVGEGRKSIDLYYNQALDPFLMDFLRFSSHVI